MYLSEEAFLAEVAEGAELAGVRLSVGLFVPTVVTAISQQGSSPRWARRHVESAKKKGLNVVKWPFFLGGGQFHLLNLVTHGWGRDRPRRKKLSRLMYQIYFVLKIPYVQEVLPILYCNLLYKLGNYFLDIQYI